MEAEPAVIVSVPEPLLLPRTVTPAPAVFTY